MMATATLTANTNIAVDSHVDKEYLASRDERRSNVTATVHGRHQAARRLEEQRKVLWGDNHVHVAPKWTRHAEDYVNPHLLEHEREPIAPRYGPDSVPSRLMPHGSDRCKCSFCIAPHAGKKGSFRRETQAGIKYVVTGLRQKGPLSEWDREGENDLHSSERLNPWGFEEAFKAPPAAELDLLAMAKPAKVKRGSECISHQFA